MCAANQCFNLVFTYDFRQRRSCCVRGGRRIKERINILSIFLHSRAGIHFPITQMIYCTQKEKFERHTDMFLLNILVKNALNMWK